MEVLSFNRTHNMELVKLDRKIQSAIEEALTQDHTPLTASDVVGVLECIKFQFLMRSIDE